MIGFKSYNTRTRWYANAAAVDLEVQKRSVPTKSGASPFRYFDGSTMVAYQLPHRTVADVFCRRQPTPEECLGMYQLDPANPNVPETSFEVKKSEVGDGAGRGLFSKVDIPEGAYLCSETSMYSVNFMPSTVSLIEDLNNEAPGEEANVLLYYMEGYGYMGREFVS